MNWTRARAEKAGRATAKSATANARATAMNTSADATAVRLRMRRSGSSVGSAPRSRTRAKFIDGLEHAGRATERDARAILTRDEAAMPAKGARCPIPTRTD